MAHPTVTVGLDADLSARLDAVARETDRPSEDRVGAAVQRYLDAIDQDAWVRRKVAHALDRAVAPDAVVVEHDAAMARARDQLRPDRR
jgi:predicted transcriptional regulator